MVKQESTFLQPVSSDLSGQSFLKSHLKVMTSTLGNLIATFENILDKEYLGILSGPAVTQEQFSGTEIDLLSQ